MRGRVRAEMDNNKNTKVNLKRVSDMWTDEAITKKRRRVMQKEYKQMLFKL
jgi:hypothetical protein